MRQYGVRSLLLVAVVTLLVSGCVAMTGETLGENIDDTGITTTVKAKLAAEKVSTLTRIGVDTVKGTVYLNGTVENFQMKQRAEEIAWQVRGVREVVNNLKVQVSG